MKKIIIVALGLLALTIPAIASANHSISVDGAADCNGWNLCTLVSFLPNTVDGSLVYTVTLFDENNDEIAFVNETVTIYPEDSAGGSFEYCYEGTWDGNFSISSATVLMTSDLNESHLVDVSFGFECTVPIDNISFDSVKSLYR